MGNKLSRKLSQRHPRTPRSHSQLSNSMQRVPETSNTQIIQPQSQLEQMQPATGRSLKEKYAFIPDQYETIDQVTAALRASGLESSNLILGIDFTKSNEWTGRHSFNGRSLHEIGSIMNPYEQAISIVGRTLSPFDEDNQIPCYGFGDATTHDDSVFSFYENNRPCNGFEQVLERYKEIVPHLMLAECTMKRKEREIYSPSICYLVYNFPPNIEKFKVCLEQPSSLNDHYKQGPQGPTSFAPVVEASMGIVEASGGQYHVLVIIADGQVTRNSDTRPGQLSPQEQKTIDAIATASRYPLSIVLVGVGDGPWDMMRQFDDKLPRREFDNFQFVNFTGIMSKNLPQSAKEAAFALAALMEIPTQYQATIELKILGHPVGSVPNIVPRNPPLPTIQREAVPSSLPDSTNIQSTASHSISSTENPPEGLSLERQSQDCPVCLTNSREMAFGCGHMTCRNCSPNLSNCPICRAPISTRLRVYSS